MNQEDQTVAQERQLLEAVDKIITVLRKGLQPPFILYSDSVIDKLKADIAPMEATPEWA